MTKKTIILALFAGAASAAVYMVPRDYDNMRMGQLSKGTLFIDGKLDDGSGGAEYASLNTYAIGSGTGLRLSCEPVEKIECGGGQRPYMYTTVREIRLVDGSSGGIMPIWDYIVATEEDPNDPNHFYICAGAYSAMSYDDSYIVDRGSNNQYFRFDYVYVPLAKTREFFWFTDSVPNVNGDPNREPPVLEDVADPASNASKSYIEIGYQQVCAD